MSSLTTIKMRSDVFPRGCFYDGSDERASEYAFNLADRLVAPLFVADGGDHGKYTSSVFYALPQLDTPFADTVQALVDCESAALSYLPVAAAMYKDFIRQTSGTAPSFTEDGVCHWARAVTQAQDFPVFVNAWLRMLTLLTDIGTIKDLLRKATVFEGIAVSSNLYACKASLMGFQPDESPIYNTSATGFPYTAVDVWTTLVLPSVDAEYVPVIDKDAEAEVVAEYGPLKGDFAPGFAGSLLCAESGRFDFASLSDYKVRCIPATVLHVPEGHLSKLPNGVEGLRDISGNGPVTMNIRNGTATINFGADRNRMLDEYRMREQLSIIDGVLFNQTSDESALVLRPVLQKELMLRYHKPTADLRRFLFAQESMQIGTELMLVASKQQGSSDAADD